MIESLNDRTTSVTTAIMTILADAELVSDLAPGELELRIWQRLREELDDIAREFAEEVSGAEHGRNKL